MLRFPVLIFFLLAAPAAAEQRPEALYLASEARIRAGLPPLAQNPRLATAAEAQARTMAERRRIGHDGADGSDFATRVRGTGYVFCAAAENVAGGQRSAREVTRSWMDSPGHRANILNPAMRHGAVAAVRDSRGQLWWAMVLAGPC